MEGKEDAIVSIQGSKRPFPDLKALDMEEVAENVITALDGQ